MNREDVLAFLTTILSAIMTHDVLISELSNMIGRSGFEKIPTSIYGSYTPFSLMVTLFCW